MTALAPSSSSVGISEWRHAEITVGLCLMVVLMAYRDTAESVLRTWSRDPLGHGFFVVPVAAYIVWRHRRQITSVSPRASTAALPVLGALSFLWLLGYLTDTVSLQQSCLVSMVVVVIWVVVGSAASRTMAFPLGLLVFGMPIGDRVAPFLQPVTGSWATAMLAISGVPAVLDGNVIDIVGTRWRISEACGGVNYIVAAVAVAYVYAGLVYKTWPHRIALVGAAFLVSFLGNAIRVYTTILLDHAGATRVAAGMGHELYGVFVFAIMIAVVFLTCGRWSEDQPPGDGPPRMRQSRQPAWTWRTVACATAAMLLVAGGPVATRILLAQPGSPRAEAPVVSGPWQAVDDMLSTWSPRFVRARSEYQQTYRASDDNVKLYVAFYATFEPGASVTSAANTLYRAPWSSTHERLRSITVRERTFHVKETLLQNDSTHLVVWNWYEVDGRIAADRYRAKLLVARAGLLMSGSGAKAIAVATQAQGPAEAERVLTQFLSHVAFARDGQRTAQERLREQPLPATTQ